MPSAPTFVFLLTLQRLQTLNQYPDFNNYLALVMAQASNEDEPTRSVAGLILKNNVKEYYMRSAGTHSLTLTHTSPLTHLLALTFGNLFTHSLARSLTHPLSHLPHSLTLSLSLTYLTHPHSHLLTHSLTHSLTQMLLFRFPNEVKLYVKRQCISAIGDPSALIRATVGLVITMICAKGELNHWPELLPALTGLLDSPQQTACEVYDHITATSSFVVT